MLYEANCRFYHNLPSDPHFLDHASMPHTLQRMGCQRVSIFGSTRPVEQGHISNLPDALLNLKRYGISHCGWNSTDCLQDKPASGAAVVVTVRQTVDEDLGPH